MIFLTPAADGFRHNSLHSSIEQNNALLGADHSNEDEIKHALAKENDRRRQREITREAWESAKSCFNTKKTTFRLKAARKRYVDAMAHHNLRRYQESSAASLKLFLARELSKKLQQRIYTEQNPANCSAVRKFYCRNVSHCGWGCMVHIMTACLLLAFGSNRILILDADSDYNKDHLFDNFLPVSNCTADNFRGNFSEMPHYTFVSPFSDAPDVYHHEGYVGHSGTKKAKGQNLAAQAYTFPGPFDWHDVVPPWTLPADIADVIELISYDPTVWYIGQFVRYILRPKPQLASTLAENAKRSPTVALHVRRLDSFMLLHQPLERYVRRANEYFDIEDTVRTLKFSPIKITINDTVPTVTNDKPPRQVYVATDDRQVLSELNFNFSEYFTIHANQSIIESSQRNQTERKSDKLGRLGVIFDAFHLASSDYLVCKWSSQIGRLAYEPRASDSEKVSRSDLDSQESLDIPWFLYWNHFHNHVQLYEALENSTTGCCGVVNDAFYELSEDCHHSCAALNLWFVTGDQIHVRSGNQGQNLRTGQYGRVCLYQVKRVYHFSNKLVSFSAE